MHVLFVHPNFPAQFGQIATYLVRNHNFRCTFASEKPPGNVNGVHRIQYQTNGGATVNNHFCSRTFENQIWHSHALYEALAARPDIQPDLIVGHSGFTSTLFLRELYDCPIINYFEYFYHTRNSDMDFRRDLPPCPAQDFLRARARNAMLLLDLNNCDAGYSPTRWQRDQLPATYHEKVEVIFDGIDTEFWRPLEKVQRQIAGRRIPDDVRIVTYVSRGLESMRGFDIFMRFAKRICDERTDTVFAVVGEDRVAYGGDLRYTGGKSFKTWVLEQDHYDLSRIFFLGGVPTTEVARLFALSDLHFYWTVPFVLSWSLMNALSCEATLLTSATAPVCEMVQHQENGLLVDFFDLDGAVTLAHQVLDDPAAFRRLGRAGRQMIEQHYSLPLCLRQMLQLYERVRNG